MNATKKNWVGRNLKSRQLGRLALAALALQAACSREICSGIDTAKGCLALRLGGNEDRQQVHVEVRDAFGQRLARLQTEASPEDLVEVQFPRPAEARCLRVWVGSGSSRKTAVARIAAGPDGRLTRSVQLSQPPAQATFSPREQKLAGNGRGVAIGRVPGFDAPVLVVGSEPAAPARSTVQFFQPDGASLGKEVYERLEVEAAPYPIVLAGNTDEEAVLGAGRSPFDAVGTSPTVFRSAGKGGTGYIRSGQVLSLSGTRQAVFLAGAHLDNDRQIDWVINWHDPVNRNSGTQIVLSGGTAQMMPLPEAGDSVLSTVLLADLNVDGLPDIARSMGNKIGLYLNQKEILGQFVASRDLLSSATLTPLGLTAADLNGDDRPDLAAAINSNNGLGEQALQVYLADGAAPGAFRPVATATVGLRPRVAVAADLNGDVLDDVVTASFGTPPSPTAPTVLYGSASERFDTQDLSLELSAGFDLAAGDLNGDCQADLALVSEQRDTVYLLMNSSLMTQ